MKRIVYMIIIIILLLLSIRCVVADELARVYSDINAYTEKSIDIPIKIKNNKGLMGYKFTLNASNFLISDIAQGEPFSDGMFNFKIGKNKETVEIIWTNNDAIKVDGELFTVKADVKNQKKLCELDIIYSPSDTIDGEYNEISLACDSIIIEPQSEKSQPTTTNTSFKNQEQEDLILRYINKMDSGETKNVVVQALAKIGESVDSKKSYTVEELTSKIKSIKSNKKISFINKFNQIISQKKADLPTIPEKDGATIIGEILDCTDEYTIKSITQPTEPAYDEVASSTVSTADESMSTKDEVGVVWIIPALVIAVCVFSAILLIIILRKRRMKNEV